MPPCSAVTLVLALVVAWGWPPVAQSRTPDATSVVLAVSAVAIVLSAARDDLEWLAAAVAFGILLSFAAQLVRRPPREGLVLTLLASFGGLVVIASGTSAVVAANSTTGASVAAIGAAAVAAALVADLLTGVVSRTDRDERVVGAALAGVALGAGVAGALVAAAVVGEVGSGAAALIGAVVGVVSWGLRRVLDPRAGDGHRARSGRGWGGLGAGRRRRRPRRHHRPHLSLMWPHRHLPHVR